MDVNLIDIEVVYKKDEKISGRLLVEGDQAIDTLCHSIKDMLEIFPNFSGLNGLNVISLQKKENNKYIDLIMNNIIKKDIKQKDVIYFDLEFTEIWINVKMTVKDENDETKVNIFSFELKTQIKTKNVALKTALIDLGIRTWEKFREQEDLEEHEKLEIQEEEYENFHTDYYLLLKFEMLTETEKKEKKSIKILLSENEQNSSDSKIDDYKNDNIAFELNDTINCSLIFINFTDYILDYATNELWGNNRPKSFDNSKINIIKNDFNCSFNELYLDKSKKVIPINKVICKISPKYYNNEEEEETHNYPLENFRPAYENYSNFQPRLIGPLRQIRTIAERDNDNDEGKYEHFKQIKTTAKKEIEMNYLDDSKHNSKNLSFKNKKKNINNDSFTLSHNKNMNMISLKSFTEEFQLRRESDAEKYYYDNNLKEINFIKNNIDFDKIFDEIDSEILEKELDSADFYKTRNLQYLDGEFKSNRLISEKDIGKKNSKEPKNIVFTKDHNYFCNHLIKKYIVIFIIIIFIILFLKSILS